MKDIKRILEKRNLYKEPQTRTDSQNNALHLFCEQLALVLRENGITLKAVIEKLPESECPATKYGIKYGVWHPVMWALFRKDSTTKLLKQREIDDIWDVLNKFFADYFKIEIPPFPSTEVEQIIK